MIIGAPNNVDTYFNLHKETDRKKLMIRILEREASKDDSAGQ